VCVAIMATNLISAQANLLNATIPEEIGMKTVEQLAADNDGDSINTKNLIDAAIKELNEQSVNINVIYPPVLDGFDKSDWNDILVLLGKDKLTQLLEK